MEGGDAYLALESERLKSHYEARRLTRKRSTKRLKLTGNLFRKKVQLKGVC